MNNGLDGRYQEQLELWNKARQIAVSIVESVFEGAKDLASVLDEHDLGLSPGRVTTETMGASTRQGRSRIDFIARFIYEQELWA